jgi:uncharacterized protein (TIGR00251 family)
MIQITDHAEGCVVNVRAQPGARRNTIVGRQGDALKIAVTAPPDKGRANASLVLVLADALGLKRSQVELIAGETSRAKKVLVRDMTAAQLRAKLDGLMPKEDEQI